MNKVQIHINYSRIVRDINAIIARGAANLREAYQRQVMVTNWEVSRYLNKKVPLDDGRSARNARIVKALAKKMGRPERYLYDLIKFYKLYPGRPGSSPLFWTHYEVLLTVDDEAKRKKYERMAIQKNLQAKILQGIIINDRNAGAIGPFVRATGQSPLQLTRGRLYHYRVAAPKDTASSTGTVTLDVGFNIFRDIPMSKKSRIRSGHIARTVKDAGASRQFTVINANKHKDHLYTYAAKVERVIDGDTIVVLIDCGLRTKTRQKLRLRGINCPELTEVQGPAVKDFVKKLLSRQEFIVVKTYKDDKYGRMLADVFYGDEPRRGESPQASPRRTRGRRGVTAGTRGRRGVTSKSSPEAVAANGMFLNQLLLDKGMAAVFSGR